MPIDQRDQTQVYLCHQCRGRHRAGIIHTMGQAIFIPGRIILSEHPKHRGGSGWSHAGFLDMAKSVWGATPGAPSLPAYQWRSACHSCLPSVGKSGAASLILRPGNVVERRVGKCNSCGNRKEMPPLTYGTIIGREPMYQINLVEHDFTKALHLQKPWVHQGTLQPSAALGDPRWSWESVCPDCFAAQAPAVQGVPTPGAKA